VVAALHHSFPALVVEEEVQSPALEEVEVHRCSASGAEVAVVLQHLPLEGRVEAM
jgi:hypothetical protein